MADKAKTPTAPSRPSLSKMREIKSAATAPAPKVATAPKTTRRAQGKSATPRVLTDKRRNRMLEKRGQAPRPAVAPTTRQRPKANAPKPRKRSATGSAAKVVLAGRHVPKSQRYKTGWWRPVRQSWMTDEVWDAVKAINRIKNKMMSKGLKKASHGEKIYGKEGPGHAGYGSGQLQKWADKMLRQGIDPHMVDLTKWFAGAAAAVDYHMGERSYEDLIGEKGSDPAHFMHTALKRMQEYIPELRKVSASAISDLAKHHYYTAQYGPDGRAK